MAELNSAGIIVTEKPGGPSRTALDLRLAASPSRDRSRLLTPYTRRPTRP